MEDIKCPMCGKSNSPDRETCQYCQARIVPLFPEMDDDELNHLLELSDPYDRQRFIPKGGDTHDNSLDWLDQIRSDDDLADLKDKDIEEQDQPLEKFKDWFNHSEEPENPVLENISDDTASPTSSLEFSQLPSLDGVPDWLAELEENSPGLPHVEIEPEESYVKSSVDDQNFNSENFANWNTESDQQEIFPSSNETGDLQAANLPSWLEAMKPVGPHAMNDEKFDAGLISVEGAGPLAGLQGVIPAEPDISYSRKPFGYSVKLQVSEHQQAHAALWEQLLHSEGKASVISKKEFLLPQNLLRTVLAFFLFLSILLALIFPELVPMSAPSMSNYPSAWAAYQAIDRIGPEKPVLMTLDYQPGTSGEMDAVVGAVVKHLVTQKAKIVFVTTHPLGAMQTERVMKQISQETGIPYIASKDYANLGYIPGGNSGLLSFISDPRRTLPFAADGNYVWEQPVFQLVNDITDFSLIVVATEDTDTARSWIEQLTTSSLVSPIVMAVSAQVEPIVAPYYMGSPSQVQGIISGLAGAAAYESVTFYPGSALEMYPPFSMVGILAVIFILVGSLINALSGLASERQKSGTNRGGGK